MGVDDILQILESQINAFAQRIDEEEITDLKELNTYFKLVHRYNRTLENANRVKPKAKDNGPDYDKMSDLQFFEGLKNRDFDAFFEQDGLYYRVTEISDSGLHTLALNVWMKIVDEKIAGQAPKPKLIQRRK